MAVQPRVIFTRFSSVASVEFRPWIDHLNCVLGSHAPAVADVSDPTVWQLVSANNRELARSVGMFAGFRSAQESAESSVTSLPVAEIRGVVDEKRGLHGWYLAVDGKPSVVCARWYLADRERTHAVNLAVSALAGALLAEGARLALDRSHRSQGDRVR